MVTKSGTNALHGDFRLFPQRSLQCRECPFPPGPSHDADSIRREPRRSSGQRPHLLLREFRAPGVEPVGPDTISPANVSAINARLAASGYPGPPIYTGLYPNPVHNSNFLAKVDHQFSAKDQFSARYSLYDVHSANSRGAGGLSAASASAGLDNTDQTVAASNIATLSPRVVNETRAQFTHSSLQALPSDPIGPAVSISGVASSARSPALPRGA